MVLFNFGFRAVGCWALVGELIRMEYDMDRHPDSEDILTMPGFARACLMTLRLKPSALLYMAVPCSAWVFMSQSVHRRCQTQPFGNDQISWVRSANILVCRSMALAALALARRGFFFLENPWRTMLKVFPVVEFMLSLNEKSLNIFHGQCYWS